MPPTDKRHHWFGLVFAYRLDGEGGGTPLDWEDIEAHPRSAAEKTWIHLDLRHPNALHWLRQDSGLDALTVDGLTATRASPRLVQRDDRLLLILKGIDYRSVAQARDMVAMRLWTNGRLLISGRREQVRAVADRCQQATDGLDAAGEITEITQDGILQRSSETTGRRLFSLTVITAVFLPLTFITGLLGVNLAGIPDAEDPYAFLILCLLLGGLVGAQLWMLRRKGWL